MDKLAELLTMIEERGENMDSNYVLHALMDRIETLGIVVEGSDDRKTIIDLITITAAYQKAMNGERYDPL